MKSVPPRRSGAKPPKQSGSDVSGEAGKALLGIYTNLGDPPQLPAKLDAKAFARQQTVQRARYAAHDQAWSLVCAAGEAEGLPYAWNHHRVAKCRWQRIALLVTAAATADQRVTYHGLMKCGSVWACPLCAPVIQEQRRQELVRAIGWVYANGYQAALVTLTFPHYEVDSLEQLLERQAEALRLLRMGSPWRRFREAVDYQGHIRSLELTYGDNGWHPHTHELYFIAPDISQEWLAARMLDMWESACVRAGLLDLNNLSQVLNFRRHAVDVRCQCQDSEYLAKQDDSRRWGVDREVAKASSKAGRASGIHPHGLLVRAGSGDRQAGELYLRYIHAMQGKNQLRWSPGLKVRCGIEEQSDEQIVEKAQEVETFLGNLDPGEWALVFRYRQRVQLLQAAERALREGGPGAAHDAILVFVEDLKVRSARERRR